MSKGGRLYSRQKSQLTSILETYVPPVEKEPEADVLIVDWSALVHALPPKRSKTFEDYAALDFLPVIYMYSSKYTMKHLVFDVYSPSNLKAETKGVRRKVTNKNTIPIYWHKFLRHNDNKTELYHFLANKVAQMFAPNMVIVTKASAVLSAHGTGLDGLNICSHQEVDSRIFVHAKHATEHGSQSIMIKANDTGVVPSPVSKRLGRCRLHLGKVRAFAGSGVRDTFHYVGQEKVKGMLFFHACTGCDTATRKLLGRHGTYVQRPCLYSPNWVFTLPRWRIPTYTGGFWRSLAS